MDILDSNSTRLGVLASRQSGKSLTVAYKNSCGALCYPATTRLIIGPTLRQSSEALLKCAGVVTRAGLKIAQQSQFHIVLADKQPGAGSAASSRCRVRARTKARLCAVTRPTA
jgi:hypothetical protein